LNVSFGTGVVAEVVGVGVVIDTVVVDIDDVVVSTVLVGDIDVVVVGIIDDVVITTEDVGGIVVVGTTEVDVCSMVVVVNDVTVDDDGVGTIVEVVIGITLEVVVTTDDVVGTGLLV